MKVKYSLILIACFAQIIICETEYVIDIVKGSLKPLPCGTYDVEGKPFYGYGFYFTALTSGFTETFPFLLQLSEPNYASATCYVPASTEGQTQEIYCVLNEYQFPILVEYITLPTNIDFSPIDPANWNEVIGVNPRVLVGVCAPPTTSTFTKSKTEAFVYTTDNEGKRVIYGTGSLVSNFNRNYLTETDTDPDYVEYYVKPYAFVDGQYGNIDCFIRTPININGGEDEIYCYPNGQTKVVFFPTISSIFSDNTDMGYLYFDAYEQVDLSGGYNYGTFKLTALLFLSLLLF